MVGYISNAPTVVVVGIVGPKVILSARKRRDTLTTEGRSMYYLHKYEVAQQYGGPEEGGWWYDAGDPVDDWCVVMVEDEEIANFVCRALNHEEITRRDEEEKYGYTDVLSPLSQHFEYDVSESPLAESFPKMSPHYE